MRLPVVSSPDSLRDIAPAVPPSTHFDTGPRSISAVKMLRISITDRCNFRCVYCMPPEGVRWLAKDDILSFEEIGQIVRAAIDVHGIRRFKLTGGEPTIRHGLVELVRQLRAIPGVEELSLTTNGFALASLAYPLKDAGLDRITISIDSLHPDRFHRITRTGDLPTVLKGLEMAEAAGFNGLKINCVAMRGTNDDEFADFARLTLWRRVTVRFIEYMPLGDSALVRGAALGGTTPPAKLPAIDSDELGPAAGCGAQERGDCFVAETEVRSAIERELGELQPVDRLNEPGVGPAKVHRLASGNPRGRIGFISAMSEPFCSTCNRLRLTAGGILRSCLFEGGEVNLRSIVRSAAGIDHRQAIARAMADCVQLKPQVHSRHGNEQMSRVGG